MQETPWQRSAAAYPAEIRDLSSKYGQLSAGNNIQKRMLVFVKKCLTKWEACANICKLSARAARKKPNRIEIWQNLGKVLDKWKTIWYHIKVARRKARNGHIKKFEKNRKKFLTNEKKCDKLKKLRDEKRKLGARHTTEKLRKNLKKVLDKVRKLW